METRLFGKLLNGQNITIPSATPVTLVSLLTEGRTHPGTTLLGIMPHGGAIYIGTSRKTGTDVAPTTASSEMAVLPQNTSIAFSCQECDLNTLFVAASSSTVVYVWEFGIA